MNYDEILNAAICAPSGDNCQPWRFRVEDGRIHLYNIPDKDTSVYNIKQRASLVAHGALIENILIASSALGYQADVSAFPDTGDENYVAAIAMKKSQPGNEPLYRFIPARTTNRRHYRPSRLAEDARDALSGAAGSVGAGRVILVEDERNKSILAEVIGINDRLVFENPNLHGFLFDHIRWNDGEAAATRDGLDIKTLDLAPPDALAFRLFLRHYSLVQTLNIFGVSKFVATNARKQARSASAVGLITIPGSTPLDYLAAGRILQRAWLEATRFDLSFQMMTGIIFLMQQVREGITDRLAPGNLALIGQAAHKLAGVCDLTGETLALMFRVGQSAPPSARSLRLPLNKVVSSAQ